MLALRDERTRSRCAMRSLCCIRTCSNASRNSRSSAMRSVGWLLLRFVRYMDMGVSGWLDGEVMGGGGGGGAGGSERRSSSSAPNEASSCADGGHASRAFFLIRCACDATAVSRLDDLEPRNGRGTRIDVSSSDRRPAASSSEPRGLLAGMGAGAGAGSVSALRGLYRSGHDGDVASASCSLNALMLRGSSMRVKGRDRASCSSCASWPTSRPWLTT